MLIGLALLASGHVARTWAYDIHGQLAYYRNHGLQLRSLW